MHWTGNALASVPKGQHIMVAAVLRQAFRQPDHATARQALLHVADMMRSGWPKLADFIIDREADVLAYRPSLPLPAPDQIAFHQPLGAPYKEVKRRADVVGIFPNGDSVIRLIAP